MWRGCEGGVRGRGAWKSVACATIASGNGFSGPAVSGIWYVMRLCVFSVCPEAGHPDM
jgi:hypothetical protein